MAEQRFIDSLEDLTGKIAIVTGGGGGIGLESTIYLAQRGATVYVASRSQEKSEQGIKTARERLGGKGGEIKFHQLDLSTIALAKESAVAFKAVESRLDILVCNAGISMAYKNVLSKDGYERMFATNHLGHFTFVTQLLDLVETTARTTSDARIVITASEGYKMARKLDYTALKEQKENDGKSLRDMPEAFKRYCDSKLANVYFAEELDRRLQARGVTNVYCNSCHPGTVGSSGLGRGDRQPISSIFEGTIKSAVGALSNTTIDASKTQTFLAASEVVRTKDIRGQYWTPVWGWTNRYKDVKADKVTELASNREEQTKLWDFSEEAVRTATSSGS